MKQADTYKTTCVQVYELRGGQSLCFSAEEYYHASIIPPQVKKTRRALLIFHGLEIVSNLGPAKKRVIKQREGHEEPSEPRKKRQRKSGPQASVGGKLKEAESETTYIG